MIVCKELPGKSFESKTEMFKALVSFKDKIISLKKAEIYKSADKGQFGTFDFKAADSNKAEFMKDGYIYPVINTTKYLDSHGDVHFDGIWTKSVKEQQGQLFYVENHNLNTKEVIAWPGEVNAFVKSVPWSFVGKNYEGETEALIYEIKESDIENDNALKILSKRRPVQNSVRMQYVKIRLAVNDASKEFAEYKAYYDSRITDIANKEAVEENGYFWGVEEAKIVKEGSMVLYGSNDATPIQYTEAGSSTSSKEEPSEDTQRVENLLKELINKI